MALPPTGLRAGQTLTLQSGGSLGDNFGAIDATFNVEGGTLGSGTEVLGSLVNISGGSVGSFFDALLGSVVNISSGIVGRVFEAQSGSAVNVTGGAFESGFIADSGSDVEFVGGEFRLNGADFSGSTITLAEDDVFIGTLADGSPFLFVESEGDSLSAVNLTVAPLPALDLDPIVVNDTSGIAPHWLKGGTNVNASVRRITWG